MKKRFKIEKMELNSFIDLLIELFENGVDYIDMISDNSEEGVDKLIIVTKEEYMNPEWVKDNPDKIKRLNSGNTELTDDTLNDLV